MRRVAADYNADRKDLFSVAGWKSLEGEIQELGRHLKAFAAKAPPREAEARAKLGTIGGVGPVTIDVVVSELGDVGRFKSSKAATSYAGLAPRVRQSGGKGSKDLGITKEGSPLLRWALVEAAWRVIRQGASWRRIYEDIKRRSGGKRAIVAVARRLLCVMYAMLRDGKNYDPLK